MKNRFVPKTIQGTIRPIDHLVKEYMPVIQETLGACETVIPKYIVTEAVRSGARILQTQREVSRTGRDGSTPIDVNTAIVTVRLTLKSPNFIDTSDFPTWTGNQDIVSPGRSVFAQEAQNSKPLHVPINQFLAVHGHYTPIFSKVIGPKIVPGTSGDVCALESVNWYVLNM